MPTGTAGEPIFACVYGLLHSADYRDRFAADLRKMLPRIPKVRDFHAFVDAGRRLLDLHLHYESVEPYALEEVRTGTPPAEADVYRVNKMRYAGKARRLDRSAIVYNDWLTLAGIPDLAHDYMLGSRSALEWLIDRYQIKTDKASGITNDPNDWGREHGEPRYVLDLVKRVTTVSVETAGIVRTLPALDLLP